MIRYQHKRTKRVVDIPDKDPRVPGLDANPRWQRVSAAPRPAAPVSKLDKS